MQRLPPPRLAGVAALLVAAAPLAAGAGACLPVTAAVPTDHPVLPMGMALSADGDHLLVVSSDFDLAFGQGAFLSADLSLVRQQKAGEDNTPTVVTSAYTSAVLLPPQSDQPVLSPLGDRVFIPARGFYASGAANTVAVVDVGADGALSCGSDTSPQTCGVAPRVLQLTQSDPFTVILLAESPDKVRVSGLVTLESSPVISFFSDDTSRTPARRMQLDGTLDLGTSIGGVRAAVLRPPVAGTDQVIIAALDLSTDVGLAGARLATFLPRADTNVANLDVTATTGSLSMRDLVLVPGEDGDNDAVVAVLRNPDALARFEIDDAGSLPTFRMTALVPTCRAPLSLAYASSVNRVLLTCGGAVLGAEAAIRTDDAVEALDPLTLDAADVVRFGGRGPYDVVVDDAAGEAYVSFMEDDSVGQFALTDGGTPPSPALALVRRIGEPTPKPEDGRQ